MVFHINKEYNPGSVGRLGAGLIHASLFKLYETDLMAQRCKQ